MPWFMLSAAQTLYNTPCPLLGPVWPALSSYADDGGVRHALKTFNQTLQRMLAAGDFGNATSFSLDFWSGPNTLLEYHHSASQLSKPSAGVSTVNSDTIYRIGSISKLLTVYTYLVNVGFKGWQDLITAYVPELATYAATHSQPDTVIPSWSFDDITVGAIASQLAGIPREFSLTPMSTQFSEIPGTTNPAGNYCGDPNIVVAPCTRAGKSSS